MRALVVRFIDCEGPGILEPILRESGYQITYHNAYEPGLELVPQAHLLYDFVLLLGGPQSVADPELQDFFAPFFGLVKGVLNRKNARLLGICLGSQIIAQALGGRVYRGSRGSEVGFHPVKMEDPTSDIFRGVEGDPSRLLAFHLHEDTFDLPPGAKHLLSSEKYSHQMFSVDGRIFGIQAHLELTAAMLDVWKIVHADFIGNSDTPSTDSWMRELGEMQGNAERIFRNILVSM